MASLALIAGATQIISQQQQNAFEREKLQMQQETNAILLIMDQRKQKQKDFEEREKKIKQDLDKQINSLKASNIKNKLEYEKLLNQLAIKNDKKLKKLEDTRNNDRIKYQTEIKDIHNINKQNMKTLQKKELTLTLQNELKLINTLLKRYKNKKQKTIKMFNNYQKKLKQVKLEQMRLSHFKQENNDPNILNIVLIGITGHGKSTFASRLAGDNSNKCDKGIFQHNAGVNSLTQDIKKVIAKNAWNTNKDLSIVDTPGILDSGGNDRYHANNLVQYLKGCGGVNAFLLVKTRNPPRFDAGFKDTLQALQLLLGNDFWKHVIVVITHTKDMDAKKPVFDKYSNMFRNNIYDGLYLDKNKIKLPFIGVDSFDNYKKPIKELINIIPKQRFKCDGLRSPLQELILKNKNTLKEFDNMKNELNAIKNTILLSKEQIDEANNLLSKMINDYKPKSIDISDIKQDNGNEWNINNCNSNDYNKDQDDNKDQDIIN